MAEHSTQLRERSSWLQSFQKSSVRTVSYCSELVAVHLEGSALVHHKSVLPVELHGREVMILTIEQGLVRDVMIAHQESEGHSNGYLIEEECDFLTSCTVDRAEPVMRISKEDHMVGLQIVYRTEYLLLQ